MQKPWRGWPAIEGALPECTPSGSSQMTERRLLTKSFRDSTSFCNSLTRLLSSIFEFTLLLIPSHPKGENLCEIEQDKKTLNVSP